MEVVTTAGLEFAPAKPTPRREAIQRIRAVLRNNQATEAESDDALEALVELSKE